ncbi:MAG: hypothetical protein J6C79_04715 [Clostridia bacterium]|nr:hypothetical protein [Clostridia bacterium]
MYAPVGKAAPFSSCSYLRRFNSTERSWITGVAATVTYVYVRSRRESRALLVLLVSPSF